MPSIEPGHVIGGKYELVALLGRGSMGEVWRARHLSLGEDLAVKLLDLSRTSGGFEDPATASARFHFEARVAARLSRKTRHIVRVTDHGEDRSALAYLAMELLEGHTLEKRLLLFGEMSPDDVCPVLVQIARALECAHAECVVHRDLKPANVFLARDEDGELLVKVLDFGIARATRTQRLATPFSTREDMVFGTPGYMSPEHAFGATIDGRADLWALATLAYEALTGALPVPGTHVQELQKNLLLRQLVPIHDRNPRLPAGLGNFFQRAFAERIEDRFLSASELASSFEQATVDRPTPETTAPMPPMKMLPGGTLPMALDSPPRSEPSSSRLRTAWLRSTVAVSVIALPTLVAARMLRTVIPGAVAPASSPAGAPTERVGLAALAPTPEEPLPTPPRPSGTQVVPPAPDGGGDSRARRANQTAPTVPRPIGAAPSAAPQQSPRLPPSALPVHTPSVAPALGQPSDIDKSATL